MLEFRRRYLGLPFLLVALALSSACGPAMRPVAAPLPIPARPVPSGPPADLAFTIPAGTFAADMRGEPSFRLPSEIRVARGQSIVVRNEDHAMHYFFDAPIAPGQSVRKTFAWPGRYGYSPGLSCSLAPGGSITVVVGED